MKKSMAAIIAILAFCCSLVVGTAVQVRAEECTTQGALALALADVLGIKATSSQAAADALALRGVGPELGWDVEACLTMAVQEEIKASLGDAGGFERALAMIDRNADRLYPVVRDLPDVSPATR